MVAIGQVDPEVMVTRGHAPVVTDGGRHLARRTMRTLARCYPEARCELDHATPLQLLIATILSAQSTDARVNRVTPALFAQYPTAADLAAADASAVAALIAPTGLAPTKAGYLIGAAQRLCTDHGGEVPRDLVALTALPGVGRKTANVVLGTAFGVPGITVDTHVGRVARRLGWTVHSDPVRAEADISALLPRRTWTQASHLLIWHGRRRCHARRPACGACPLRQCPSRGLGPTDPVVAGSLVRQQSRR